ncbi:ATP-dependent DNA helicase MPH1 [Scheffersomyces xylosifermentans]|uniref:ATP-dependent DNA helicase MPH1 n=1 Tax=Scheffersomyces xylosifermentans TaxID=1304137 RepID=UPI00315D9EF2
MPETDDGEDSPFFDDDDEEFDELLRAELLPTGPDRDPGGGNGQGKNSIFQVQTSVIPNRQLFEVIPEASRHNKQTHHNVDYNSLQKYIYPTNFEIRDYQYNIVRRAFYDNLLVALPTGLGKTFIASTVMLNFLRWFPDSKLIFVAPTKPLVAQQIKACCSITGIPSSKVAILLDKTRKNRGEIWNEKQVFFTTPQVVENDLASGLVDPKSIVLLVIDEAHRAKGNYAYNNIVKFLDRFNNSYRTLALTATPASDVDGVQEIINNLHISKVEVRTEQSIDIIKYMKRKRVQRRTIFQSDDIKECIDLLCTAIAPVLKVANERNIYEMTEPHRINFFQCMEASRKIVTNPTIPEGLKWANFFILQLLGVVGQCFRRLNIYGIRSFFSYFSEKHLEFTTKWNKKKSTNKLNADFYFSEPIKELLEKSKKILSNPKVFSHPKIEALMEELDEFFTINNASDSKVIIFTEFRDSALEIVQSIESVGQKLKPHIFIGQSKEKDKFDDTAYQMKGTAKKGGKKKAEKDSRPSTRSSSEDAQINGMNQKLQKEIIKKFKQGEFNILVATSIGEEGLDIGEVDLIICYDSTSSPIKNIQRMGRTGRKRDGKVVLLFSSNEESKFDKAMNGYEYIQQHIMRGEFVELHPQNRIVPKEFEPVVEEKFIEIPEENLEIEAVEDEDDIIRIATNYMVGGKKSKKKAARSKEKGKHEKRFFMPDDVETGFRSVTSMLRRVGSDKTLAEENHQKDFLDKLVDSASEDEEMNDEIPLSTTIKSVKNNTSPSSIIPKKTRLIEDNSSENDRRSPAPLISQDANSGVEAPPQQPPAPPPPAQRRSDLLTPPNNSPIPSKKRTHETVPTVYDTFDIIKPTKKRSLGVKKPPRGNSIIDQLKRQSKKIVHSPQDVTIIDEVDLILPNYDISLTRNNSVDVTPQNSHSIEAEDNDFFDDGLDDELAMISGEQIESFTEQRSFLDSEVKGRGRVEDVIYQNTFENNDGLLNDVELMELYTSYFTTIDPAERKNFYDPFIGIHTESDANCLAFCGKICHSKRIQSLLLISKKPLEGASYIQPSKNIQSAVKEDDRLLEDYISSSFIVADE